MQCKHMTDSNTSCCCYCTTGAFKDRELLLTERSVSQLGRVGRVGWLGMSERSRLDRVVCEPDSRPVPPSQLPRPSSPAHQFTHTQTRILCNKISLLIGCLWTQDILLCTETHLLECSTNCTDCKYTLLWYNYILSDSMTCTPLD